MLSVVKKNLQPAGAGGNELSGIAGSPAFSEADAHTVRVIWPIQVLRLLCVLQMRGLVVVEHLDRVAWQDFAHHQAPAAIGNVQRWGVDKDRVLAAVVGPHSIRLLAQQDAVANLAPRALDGAAAVLQAELAQAEACALR